MADTAVKGPLAFTASNGTTLETYDADFAQLNGGGGYCGITSNKLTFLFGDNTQDFVWREGTGTYTADQYSAFTITDWGGGASVASLFAICRASADTGANRDFYILRLLDSSPVTTTVERYNNGTQTVLDSRTSVAWATNDTVKFRAVANGANCDLQVVRNGTLAYTITDTSPLAGGKPGLGMRMSSAGFVSLDLLELGDASTDTTAPTLSSPTGTGSTLTSAGTVTTDEGNGTLYMVTTASATTPTKAQVKAGQDHTGAAALRVTSVAVASTGTKTFTASACTSGTRYNHYMHEDAAGNQSNVSASASFVVGSGVTFSGTVPAQSGVTGTSFSLDLSTYFSGNMSRTYAVQSGSLTSSGLGLNTSSGVISGTLGTVGGYTITVRATDTYSDTDDTNSFTITISSTGTAPTVSSNPSNLTVTAGATASFTAAASGSPTPTVQWQENTGSWTNISGQTTTTLSLGVVGVPDNGRVFRAVFTNSSGTATTTSATLTVNAATGDGTLTSEPLRRNNGSLVGATTLTWLGVRNDSTGADLLVMTSVSVNSSSIFTTGANAAFAIGQTYAVQWKESGGAHGQATVIAT